MSSTTPFIPANDNSELPGTECAIEWLQQNGYINEANRAVKPISVKELARIMRAYKEKDERFLKYKSKYSQCPTI